MRNQYKVLAEKYQLIVEASAQKWDIEPGDVWYNHIKNSGLPMEIIDWFNTHGKKWASEVLSLINLDDWSGEAFLEWSENNMLIKIYDEEEPLKGLNPFQHLQAGFPAGTKERIKNKAIKYTLMNLYDEFLPWYKYEQKRLAALNKDNPGIEMDI